MLAMFPLSQIFSFHETVRHLVDWIVFCVGWERQWQHCKYGYHHVKGWTLYYRRAHKDSKFSPCEFILFTLRIVYVHITYVYYKYICIACVYCIFMSHMCVICCICAQHYVCCICTLYRCIEHCIFTSYIAHEHCMWTVHNMSIA